MCMAEVTSDANLKIAVSASLDGSSLGAPEARARSLNNLLLLCMDDVLVSILGRQPKEAIYDCLERNRSLARIDIPNHLEEFTGLLEKIFGRKGGRTIGKSIIRKLVDELDWKFEDEPDFDFRGHIEKVRARFVSEHI